jgi:hypothetical protein
MGSDLLSATFGLGLGDAGGATGEEMEAESPAALRFFSSSNYKEIKTTKVINGFTFFFPASISCRRWSSSAIVFLRVASATQWCVYSKETNKHKERRKVMQRRTSVNSLSLAHSPASYRLFALL